MPKKQSEGMSWCSVLFTLIILFFVAPVVFICMGVAYLRPGKVADKTSPTTDSHYANAEIWTLKNRPDWVKRPPAEAPQDLKDIFEAMEKGLRDGDWLGIGIHPITIWTKADSWNKLSAADRRGILATVSLYFTIRSLDEQIGIRDADSGKYIERDARLKFDDK